jgi:hypothetical protein
MTESTVPDPVVPSPTYMADIRFFFRPVDVDHMGTMGIDLGTYDGVKNNALVILAHTAPPDADMPPDQAGKWSAARSQTFRNWIRNGFPQGTATDPGQGASPGQGTSPGQGASPGQGTSPGAPPARVRKNVTNLSAQEIEALKAAFTGIMGRSPDDPASFFALGGEHGLPRSRGDGRPASARPVFPLYDETQLGRGHHAEFAGIQRARRHQHRRQSNAVRHVQHRRLSGLLDTGT